VAPLIPDAKNIELLFSDTPQSSQTNGIPEHRAKVAACQSSVRSIFGDLVPIFSLIFGLSKGAAGLMTTLKEWFF